MIKEGTIISVEIIGEAITPKGDHVYIASFQSKRFMLSKKLLHNKNIQIGQFVDCYVDKINCSGQIFIEPISDKLAIGNTISLTVLGNIAVSDSLQNTKYHVELQTKNGIQSEIISYYKIDSPTLECKIIGLKNAKLLVEDISNLQVYNQKNQIYEFQVIREIDVAEIGKSLYVRDAHHNSHIIPYSIFKHYNLRTKQKISCRVLGFDKFFNLKLEPKHPYYEIGNSYFFKTIRMDSSIDELGNIIQILIVVDKLGKEANIVQLPNNYKQTEEVEAIVYRINNGRLYLYLK